MLNDSEHAESDAVKQFALLTLGELGHRIPLGPKVIQARGLADLNFFSILKSI